MKDTKLGHGFAIRGAVDGDAPSIALESLSTRIHIGDVKKSIAINAILVNMDKICAFVLNLTAYVVANINKNQRSVVGIY